MKLHEIAPSAKFASVSTTTPGKFSSTEWLHQQSKFHRTRDLCIYLVGNGEGLKRHIDDKISLGFKDLGKHIVVEISPDTYLTLINAYKALVAKRPEYTGVRIVNGNIVDEVKKHPPGTVTHVDFDTASAFTHSIRADIATLAQHDVDNIHVVVSTRHAKSEQLQQMWPEQRDTRLKVGGNWAMRSTGGQPPQYRQPPIRDILTDLIKNTLLGDDDSRLSDEYAVTDVHQYRGRSDMIAVVLNRHPR